MGNELMDSVVNVYHATVTAPIDSIGVMYTVIIVGVVISLYNIIAGITIARTETRE